MSPNLEFDHVMVPALLVVGLGTRIVILPSPCDDAFMTTEKTKALVIRQADFSETSRVVTWFTRDHGKISTLAKGAKRLRGPFESAIDLLSVCEIVFIRKASNTLDLLTEAKLVSRFRPAPQQLKSLYGGYYVAELLNGLTEEYDPHPELFEETCTTLEAIASEEDSWLPVLQFELTMLRELGQLPSFDHCEKCGDPVGESANYVFWVSQGGLLCHKCQHDRYRQNRIQPGTVAVLQKLTDLDTTSRNNLVISPAQFREIRHLVTGALSQILGRRPKMLRYLYS